MKEDEKLTIILVSVVAIALLLGGGAFAYYRHIHQSNTVSTSAPDTGTPLKPTPSDKDANDCYTPDTVRKHYGETDCVDYSVGYTHTTSAGTKFLDQLVNYSAGFVGYIPWNSGARNMDIDVLLNKNIKVTGDIQEYNGYPEIIINDPSQVRVYQ